MRRRSKQITAALLAVLLTATTVFSDATVVKAESIAVETQAESNEVESNAEKTANDKSSDENTDEKETPEASEEKNSDAAENSSTEETQTETETQTEAETQTESPVAIDEDNAEAEVLTVAQFKEKKDTSAQYAVKGIVTYVSGKTVYLQDDTAGICVYYSSADKDIKIGNTLTAKGTYKCFNGLDEVDQAVTVERENTEILVEAKELTIEELLNAHDTYEGQLVSLKNVKLGEVNTSGNTALTDEAGKTVNIYRCKKLGEDFTEGVIVDVTAIVSEYNNLQLIVRNASDVTLVKKNAPEENPDLYDPISDEMIAGVDGAINVKEAAALTKGTATVVGQVVYAYPSKPGDTLINIILEDVIDHEVYGYLVYDYKNYKDYKAGDIVAVTGSATVYSGVPELKDITSINVLDHADAIDAQEVTLSELGADYLSEYVYIKDVTLGAYNAGGATPVKDATGESTIFKGAAFPEGITEGSVVDMYAACTAYKTTYQLKTATAQDYQVKGGSGKVEIDDSITLPVASFAGTANLKDKLTVNADLYEENDMLDTSSSFAAYKGGAQVTPYIENSTKDKETGVTTYTYSLGSKQGLAQDDYFLIKTDASHFENMELSFRTRGSKTAARNFVVEYSVDGESYKAAGDAHIFASYHNYATNEDVKVDKTVANGEYYIVTDSKYQDVSVKLPAEAQGAKELYIKVKVKDNGRIDGKTSGISGSATTYINSITLKGNPLKSDAICQYVTVAPEEGETSIGQELTFATDTKQAKIFYAFGRDEFKEYNANEKPVITELPCTVTAYAVKNGKDDSIRRTFKFTQSQVATVKATPNGGAVALNSKVKLACDTEGAQILYAVTYDEKSEDPAPQAVSETEEAEELLDTQELTYDWQTYTEPITLTKLPCSITVKATKANYLDSEAKTLVFTARTNEKYSIYFGQMHAHTNYSDGAGSCEEAFDYAKNKVDNLDFLCVTDHSNSFDNADSANIKDGSASEEWKQGHELAKKYTDDKFVGIMGYEMTWSNGLGHINTFNSEGFQSRTQADYKTYATALTNYYKALQTAPDTISQFNHPGTTFGDFQDFAYYSDVNDSLINLIEVGNGEGAIGSSGYFPSYEYYQRALDKGWHVSPTNNQDNHKGKWGSANTARSVVLADSLTEDNIYDAMRNNRVYATEDNDLSIYYTLNDYIMGSVVDKDILGDKLTLSVDLNDPTDAVIGKVQVIANGGIVVDSKDVNTNDTNVTFEVDNRYSFYYIKVIEKDGDIAVTSPVWTGEVEAVGINGLTTSTKLPIKDEAVDITLDLYNNEKTPLELQSVTFTVNDKVVKSVDLSAEKLTEVAPEGTASYTFNYTHSKVGAMTMNVEVKALLNGVEKVYTDKLSLTYVDNSMVSHIVIDGSHYNDYVTGYYGGNMGNFISMAAEKNVKAEIVTEPFTKDTLKNASALIVSTPGKKVGTANAGDFKASHFEPEFLEIVKEYVANGGTVIVCGLADYQDTAETQCATETNKLLEAIGSTIRMNSDEAYDDVNNGGQPYRLYYKNFNLDNPYMAGVISGENGQTYSAYSGCTVNITNAKENDTVKEAVALVKGFDTTYSINCKNADGSSGDNGVDVEKGNVVALACQETKAGGMIFVGGTVFMSDFEVKAELDNNDSLPYANYTLMNNILDTKKVVMKASDIATVRKGSMGDPFAIEGYVANGTDNADTKFFDTIYVEDATGGITVFPFAKEGIKKGTKIRVVGYVDEYQGDKELQITSYEILDDKNLKEIKPTKRTTKEATDYEKFGGSFTQVTGKVTRVLVENGVVSEFWLRDNTGVEAAVFIDGYILSGTTGQNTLAEFVKEGAVVTAAGFLYLHPEGDSEVSVPVLRVPDCDEIQLSSEVIDDSKPSKPSVPATPTTPADNGVKAAVEKTVDTVYKTVKNIVSKILPISTPETNGRTSLALTGNTLKLDLLTKYYAENNLPMTQVVDLYLDQNVGFTVLGFKADEISSQSLNLEVEKKELPGNAVWFKPEESTDLGFTMGMHMNLGDKYAGKKVQVYVGSAETQQWKLEKETVIAENGNIGIFTDKIEDVLVFIEQ